MTCIYGAIYLLLVDGWYSYYNIADFFRDVPGGLCKRIVNMIILVELSLLVTDGMLLILQNINIVLSLFITIVVQSVINFFICDRVASVYESYFASGYDVYWRIMFTNTVVVSMSSLMYICIHHILKYMGEKERRLSAENEQEKIKNTLLNERLDRLAAQSDSHFVFNCFSSLNELIREKSPDTETFLLSFSNMYRYLLTMESRHVVTIEEEIGFVRQYANLVQIRHPDVEVIIDDCPGTVESGYTFPSTIQMLVRNAVMHNAHTKENKLKIEIRMKGDSVAVTNNIVPLFGGTDSTGLGLENMRNKYKVLTHKEVTVINSDNEFTVVVPVLYMEDLRDECTDNRR